MKTIILSLIAVLAMSLSCPAQILRPILHSKTAVTTTNTGFVGNFTANTASGSPANPLVQSYTCASTSNRLILYAQGQSTLVTSFTLTDTGSQMAGATIIFPFTLTASNGTVDQAWNVGCAAGANTFSLLSNGVANPASFLQFYEASGVGTGGTATLTRTATGPTFTASGTAATSGTLAVAFAGVTNRATTYVSVTSGWNYRQDSIPSGGNPSPLTSYPVFDNLNVPSGAVSFSMTVGGGTGALNGAVLLALIPGTAAVSPNWYPVMIQASSLCGGTPATVMPQSVTSGNLLAVAVGSELTNVPTSVTDTLGTTFTLRKTVNGSSNNMWLYTGIATASGADTITPAGTFSSPCSLVAEFSAAGLGQTVSDTGSQAVSTGSMTWTQTVSTANSIVFASCRGWHGTTTFQFPGGPTFTGTWQSNGSDAISGEWARTVSTASVTPIITISTTDNNVCASMVIH